MGCCEEVRARAGNAASIAVGQYRLDVDGCPALDFSAFDADPKIVAKSP
jgi:hypothetical protein